MYKDPHWIRANKWLSQEIAGDIGVLGIPCNHSISPGHPEQAPAAIRHALQMFSTWGGSTETQLLNQKVKDYGNLVCRGLLEHRIDKEIVSIREVLSENRVAILLGGDNAITRPGVRSLSDDLSRVGLITLDSHLDVRHMDDGLNNGNPIRALLLDGLPGANIYQIGIENFTNSEPYWRFAKESGNSILSMEDVRTKGLDFCIKMALGALESRVDQIYFDLDVDVLDRAFAPACPGSRPGGITPSEMFTAARIMGAHPKVRAMDLVEIDPERDINDQTALVAAQAMLHFCAGVATR